MKFGVFANFRESAAAVHVVFSWMLLLFFGAAAIRGSIRSEELHWAMGAVQPSALSHTMPEEDFANLWSAGHLIRLGRIDWLYSANLFETWRQAQFGASLIEQDWVYPPTVLLLLVPLSYLPLVPSFLLWDIGTLIIAIFLLRWARLPWLVVLVGILAPATWRSLALGQFGTITGAMVVAGLLVAPRNPLRAGLMLGLVTMKPQQGMIVPVAWLASRSWRAIAAAGMTLALLVGAATILFGWHGWALFFKNSSVMGRAVLDAPPPQDYIDSGVSIFWMCRTLGSTVTVADLVQVSFAAVAAVLTYLAWKREAADPLPRIAFTVCASLLITPYGHTSDMVAFSIAVAMMVSQNRWRLRVIDVFFWLWPYYGTIVTIRYGILWTPLVVCAAAGLAWSRMRIKIVERRLLPA